MTVGTHSNQRDQAGGQDVCVAFGARVRTLRKARGLNQQQLGDKAGMKRTYIGGVERGERNLGLINILRLARALDVSPRDLL